MAERRDLPKGIRRSNRKKLSDARLSHDPQRIAAAEAEVERIRISAPTKLNPEAEMRFDLNDSKAKLESGEITGLDLTETKIRLLWLRNLVGEIDPGERSKSISKLLDETEQNSPSIYEELNKEISYNPTTRSPITRITKIRDDLAQKYPRQFEQMNPRTR